MLKYLLVAAGLKLFSASPQTRSLYRVLGNTWGARRRLKRGLLAEYIERARYTLELCQHYGVSDGDRLLEIGTGWVHWESTIIRLCYDVEMTMFDVWDNRQFTAYQYYCQQFAGLVDQTLGLDGARSARAHQVLQAIGQARGFDEVYNLLGFRYVVDGSGRLDQLPDATFAALLSCNVLEHAQRALLPALTQDFYRVLQPGGYSFHKIDIGDHLSYYDRSVSKKHYLHYSDQTWQRYLENEVQYFNRVQRPEWLTLFQSAGFALVDEEIISNRIDTSRISPAYRHLSPQDLACVATRLVHRKPVVSHA